MQRTYKKVVRFLSSKWFFFGVVALFVLQALWVAFSYRYPMLYDEKFHFGLIKLFSHHLYSPIILNQPQSYDIFRDLVHEGSNLYHYIMAFPFSFIQLFTKSLVAQVIILRIINIILFGGGIILFGRLFKIIGIKQHITNITMLFLVLLPMSSLVPATINYDNMLFPLSALFFIASVQIIKSKRVDWLQYALVISVGCISSLVKSEFLIIFFITFVYLSILIWRRYNRKFYPKLKKSFLGTKRLTQIVVVSLLVVFGAMFTRTYIWNTVRYGKPNPNCVVTLGQQRCMSNDVIKVYRDKLASKNDRPVQPLTNYLVLWVQTLLLYMASTANSTGSGLASGHIPLLYFMLFIYVVIGVFGFIYNLRNLLQDESLRLLIITSVILMTTLLLVNIGGNYKYNFPSAIQTRYLYPIIPIIMALSIVSWSDILKRFNSIKLASLCTVLALFVFCGGGLSTHILVSKDGWYWQSPKVIKANNEAKKVLSPFIKEKYGKYGI